MWAESLSHQIRSASTNENHDSSDDQYGHSLAQKFNVFTPDAIVVQIVNSEPLSVLTDYFFVEDCNAK